MVKRLNAAHCLFESLRIHTYTTQSCTFLVTNQSFVSVFKKEIFEKFTIKVFQVSATFVAKLFSNVGSLSNLNDDRSCGRVKGNLKSRLCKICSADGSNESESTKIAKRIMNNNLVS